VVCSLNNALAAEYPDEVGRFRYEDAEEAGAAGKQVLQHAIACPYLGVIL